MTKINLVEHDYALHLHDWQQNMETGLRAEDGWLTMVGLDWLDEGDNSVGSAPTTDVTLPNAAVPSEVGVLHLEHGRVALHITTDMPVLVNGLPVKDVVLHDDSADEPPTKVQIGSVTFFIIKRGDQYAVRIRDTQSHARQTFSGRAWFPADESYRVVGHLIPHASEQPLEVESANGPNTILSNPGRVEFELHGEHLSLEAAKDGDQLWFIFRDGTSGISTYGASRFLKAPFTSDGTVDLDFNKAYHPPCGFTAYATCPLPPRQNRLTIAIEAGEKLPV